MYAHRRLCEVAPQGRRRHRIARGARTGAEETATGSIRGRVEVPSGEPVAYVYVENIFEPAVHGHKEVIQQKEKRFIRAGPSCSAER